MGFRFQRRIRLGGHVYLNLSKGMPSLSLRAGNVTVNSKRGVSVRTGIKGLSWRS